MKIRGFPHLGSKPSQNAGFMAQANWILLSSDGSLVMRSLYEIRPNLSNLEEETFEGSASQEPAGVL
jgi:hypothetical protein